MQVSLPKRQDSRTQNAILIMQLRLADRLVLKRGCKLNVYLNSSKGLDGIDLMASRVVSPQHEEDDIAAFPTKISSRFEVGTSYKTSSQLQTTSIATYLRRICCQHHGVATNDDLRELP